MGHRNVKGLTPFGMAAIGYMMKKGMMIDIDHMSEKSATQALALGQLYKYPLNSGHNGFREEGGNENSRTADQVKKIVDGGGMMGLGHGETADNFVKAFHLGMRLTGGKQLAIGTDVNGLYSLPAPPKPAYALANNNPFRYVTMGNKTWDFNRDGVAHYGLLPAYIESWKNAGMTAQERNTFFSSAEYFAQMWEKCEDGAVRLNKVEDGKEVTFTIPVQGVLCPTTLVSGDREFGGHGPAIVCNARLAITTDKQGIELLLDYSAKETDNGDTHVTGRWSKRVYNAPGGSKISGINLTDMTARAFFTSAGAGAEFGSCNEGIVYNSQSGTIRITGTLIKSIIMVGDTGGPDVSADPNNCRCDVNIKQITFNPVKVTLEPIR
jgi:Membrane dipeptidase (Peptidase family M19)